ncbi:uncharacterized protein LOC131947766 [Physella acuta]|uniref:uncharacterized protein LOC131947766 n=1 Tax=Physella acuta TaxID=109671 RepID=UPI0027DE6F8C|nr:uncharacterized protein LOC131947766 [Physella acuta]
MEDRTYIKKFINNNRSLFMEEMPALTFIEEFPGLEPYQREEARCKHVNSGDTIANSYLLDAMMRLDDFVWKFIEFCNERDICQIPIRRIERELGRRTSKPRGADYSPAVGGYRTMDQPVGGYRTMDQPVGGYRTMDQPVGGYRTMDQPVGGYRTMDRSSQPIVVRGGNSVGAYFINNLNRSHSISENTDVLKAGTIGDVNRNELDQTMSNHSTLQVSTVLSEFPDLEMGSFEGESLKTTMLFDNLQLQVTRHKDRETNDCLSDETLVKTSYSDSTTVSDSEADEPLHEVTEIIPTDAEPVSKVSEPVPNVAVPVAGQGISVEVSQESAHDSASASNTLEESFQDVRLTNTSTNNSNNSQAVVPRDNSNNSHAVVPPEQRQTETQSANDTGERTINDLLKICMIEPSAVQ